MTRDEVLAKVREIVAAQGPLNEPAKDDQPLFYVAANESVEAARARGEYELDSLDRVEVAMEVEEAFDDVDIDDREMKPERFNTIAQITDLVWSKIQERS